MHWRGHSDEMDALARLRRRRGRRPAPSWARRLEALADAGVDPAQVVLDPGLGFAKSPRTAGRCSARSGPARRLGRPLLVGASRKRFLGHLLGGAGEPVPPAARDDATAAVSALAAAAGAWCVRVHEVRASADAVRVAAAWAGARG